jgi:isopenicillin-N N-acyltransferase-like protein
MDHELSRIKVVTVEGGAYERGRQHGEQAGDEIALGVERYMDRFAHFAGIGRDEVCAVAERYVEPMRTYDPAMVEELEGIAAGSELPFREVLALNCRSEIMYSLGSLAECTSFALLPDVTATGHTYVGQNWDWAPDTRERLIVLVVRQDPRPALVLVDEAGMIGRMGFSSAGIALASNTLIAERAQIGVPYNALLRGILNSSTLADAIGALVRPKRALGANFLIGDAAGNALDIEASAFHIDYIVPRDGLIVHGNHFAGQRLHGRDMSLERFPDSLYRESRLRAHFEACGDAITTDQMIEGLCDSFGAPNAICRTVDLRQEPLDRIETVASFIIDVTAGELLVCSGSPDVNEYTRLSIAELTGEPVVGLAL